MGAGTLAGVGWAELTREGAELRALEHFEFHGLLGKITADPNSAS